MRQIVFLFLFLFLFINLVSADPAYAQGKDIDLRKVVRVSDGIPSSSASCNLTVWYSNGTLLVFNKRMTNNYTTFNYTLNSTLTKTKGEYDYEISCVQGELNGSLKDKFIINYGGVEPNAERSDSISRSIWFIFIVAILLFIVGMFSFKTPYKVTAFLLCFLFFIIGLNLLFIDLQDVIVNPNYEEFFDGFTSISFIMYYGIGISIIVLWMITFIVAILDKRMRVKKERYGQ